MKVVVIRLLRKVARFLLKQLVGLVFGKDLYKNMPLVVVESHYKGDVEENVRYARACMHDCLSNGEIPFASHLLFTQNGILDDNKHFERNLGIVSGLIITLLFDKTVVYTKSMQTTSSGMEQGMGLAKSLGRQVEKRVRNF